MKTRGYVAKKEEVVGLADGTINEVEIKIIPQPKLDWGWECNPGECSEAFEWKKFDELLTEDELSEYASFSPGDTLAVKETWGTNWRDERFKPSELACGTKIYYFRDNGDALQCKTRQSNHMPLWACRTLREVESVKVEQRDDVWFWIVKLKPLKPVEAK